MKVLVIPSWYPSKSYPNNGSFFREQIEALKKTGVDVTVLCIEIPYRKTKKDFAYFKKNMYTENGVEVYRYVFPLGILHRFPRLYYKFLKWIGVYIYEKELKKKGYDAVHAHSFLIGGYVGICIKEKYNCNCVITEHSSKILRGVLNRTEKEILKECVEKSNQFVCVSNNLKNYIEEIVGIKKKILVYPNMVSSFFRSSKKDSRSFSFVSIGNLIPGKRMDLLIKGFCKCFTKDENVDLKIIGGGEEYEKLINLIKENHREKQIVMLGALQRRQVAEILSQSNVMALVSEMETFGVVYIEALACGNVIVGAKNGGANDIITCDNGIFIRSYEVDAVAEALRFVYEHYSDYDSKKIRSDCMEKYGEDTFAKFYTELFDETC